MAASTAGSMLLSIAAIVGAQMFDSAAMRPPTSLVRECGIVETATSLLHVSIQVREHNVVVIFACSDLALLMLAKTGDTATVPLETSLKAVSSRPTGI